MAIDDVTAAARRLCPEPVEGISVIQGGANSRVYELTGKSGRKYALKRYPIHDDRPRQEAEAAALQFLEKCSLQAPRLIARDDEKRFSLLSWLEGEKVSSLNDADVQQFAEFQIQLHRMAGAEERNRIGAAAEACISGARILNQIGTRLDRLHAVQRDTPGFDVFMKERLLPAFEEFERRSRATYRELSLDFDSDLPQEKQCLIASDFGAHNALRQSNGKLAFLDFEYFGWDDPATSIANFIQHPGMNLSDSQKQAYRSAVLTYIPDAQLAKRLKALLPLFTIRWCAIVLGELLPEKWRHRLESDPNFGNWEEVKQRQMKKAEALLSLQN